jgi:hypothetical protein
MEGVLMANVKLQIHAYVILVSLRTQNPKINVYQFVSMVVYMVTAQLQTHAYAILGTQSIVKIQMCVFQLVWVAV